MYHLVHVFNLKFLNFSILSFDRMQRVKKRHRAKCLGDRSNQHWDVTVYRFSQVGGRLQSWISYMRVWSTHEEYFVFFIVCKI